IGGRDAAGHDSITIDSIVATTSAKGLPTGHAKVAGWIKDLTRSSADPTFSLSADFNMFHAYDRRSVADVFLSTPGPGDVLRLRGSASNSTLSGALRVDRGAIFLADPDIARKQAVQFQFAGDSIGTQERPASALMQTLMTNLQIPSVPVTLGSDVRLRSKDANVKLDGELLLETSVDRSTRTLASNGELVPGLGLVGTLRTENGTYNLNLGPVQREFQVLPGGTVTFNGPPDDPVLDISAKFDVKQVRDLSVTVRLSGPLLPYPRIDLSGPSDYQISTSDLVSYLLTGSPGFDFGANASTTQVVSSLLAPTLSAVAANALRPSLGSFVDVFQLQLGAGPGTVTSSSASSTFSQYLAGSSIGADKQFGNVYLNLNTGFCQFTNTQGQSFNPLYGVGAKAEYRFAPKLALRLAYDPPTLERNCTQQALTGLVPTPANFSLSLSHVWRF
ncbi:MAG TPA: translocation/assembly module TamB domain-containing protein, partial [Gemmatimonadaceae bacterium]|nr:translocation/assembly module TamB domain-containing protein [Gemmatimonadaceae bacterium]